MSYNEREKFYGSNWHAFNDAVEALLGVDASDVVDEPDTLTGGTEGTECALIPISTEDIHAQMAAQMALLWISNPSAGELEATEVGTAACEAIIAGLEMTGEPGTPPTLTVIDNSRDNASLRAAIAEVSKHWQEVKRWAKSAGKNPEE